MTLARVLGCALTAAVGIVGVGLGPAQATHETARSTPQRQAQQAKSITLITGDVVRVGAGKPGAEAITMANPPGHKPTPVKVHRTDRHTYVYPVAQLPDLYAQRLDPALFDVTTLVADGYDDARTKTIPLLVTYAGNRTQAATRARASTFAGAQRIRVLPTIGASALVAPKSTAKAFWNDIDDDRNVAKIRLDRRVRASLDQSVPQIGAPTAWAKGLTGKGIKVAVVDSGMDATHPDLAGKVLASANFSSSPDATDRYGHGTHVASIAAGKGGRHRGVAPDATLVSAKVLGDDGTGSLSSVVAGIEWAVAQGAQVVNLSLGAEDTWEIDPVEEAVNRLTAAKGTLFVVAAGNSPYCSYDDTYVNSPATADSALAVAAVDKSDELAWFSCRGPREPDGAIKPELAAPGVDIVAARAAGTSIGEPVDDTYTKASGTSMAAPHVAGSAAILLQQHPAWKASELRARLMSTAKSLLPQEEVENVGAGRVDVAHAVNTAIQVSAGKLELGYFRWPYDKVEPSLRELTYANSSAVPITLSLVATVDLYGDPVPAGTLTLDRSTLTVPAHGSAKVVVRLDPTKTEPGSYAGVLTAKAGTETWTTPIGWRLETEVYDLKVKGINRDGSPMTTELDVVALDAEDVSPVPSFPVMRDGEKILRLPKGAYSVGALALTQASETSPVEATAVVTPDVTLDRDVTVTLDARPAKPVTVEVEGVSGLSPIGGYFGYLREADNGIAGGSYTIGGWVGNDFQRFAVPSAPARTGQLELLTYARLAKAGVVYDVAIPQARSIPSDLAYRVEQNAFARIDTSFGTAGGTGVLVGDRWKLTTPLISQASDFLTVVEAGTRRTTYVLANQVKWAPDVVATTPEAYWDQAFYEEAPRQFKPGERLVQRWQHPIATQLIAGQDDGIWGSVVLVEGSFRAGFNAFMDERGRFDDYLGRDVHRMTLSRDGKELGTADERIGDFEVPAGAGTYQLGLDSARSYAWWQRSTKISSLWTVKATGRPTSGRIETLPVLLVEYDVPSADLDGDVPSDRSSSIQLAVSHQAGSRAAKVTDVKLELSFDGTHWRSVPVVPRGGNAYTAASFHPRSMAGRTVSVRVDVRDQDGNQLRQTVTDAYGVR